MRNDKVLFIKCAVAVVIVTVCFRGFLLMEADTTRSFRCSLFDLAESVVRLSVSDRVRVKCSPTAKLRLPLGCDSDRASPVARS